MPDRPHIFFELTNSLCATCFRKVEAKVVIEGQNVYLHKWCPEHRFAKVLISTDAEYYKLCRQTLKAGQMPLKFNTPIKYGCPYDCGLCPDHEQHSCLTLIEVTDRCNLRCTYCLPEGDIEFVAREEILRFFDGFDLVEPGLTYVPQWRPDSPADVPDDPSTLWFLVGVASKP